MEQDAPFKTLSVEELENMLKNQNPRNEAKTEGFALVNVLSPEQFREQHIPGSINIPKGQEVEFSERYDKEKPIIVYCASKQCSASPQVAEELSRQGFTNVYDFEAGVEAWKQTGHSLESA